MATYKGFNVYTEVMVEAGNQGSDAFTLCLTNAAPTVATDTTVVSELAAGNGYSTGGVACATASSAQTAGVYKLTLTIPSPTWTSSTGNMGPFRYVILYNSTRSQCVAYWDYGVGGVTLNGVNGDTFTVTVAAEIMSITTPT